MTKDLPSPELLRKLLRYEPQTGLLFWRHRDLELFDVAPNKMKRAFGSWNSKYAGKHAFKCLNKTGYKKGIIFGISLLAHRVIWAMEKNSWPEDQIDHIDGDRTNNKIENLREVSAKINARNRKLSVSNKTGVIGVHYCKTHNVYVARMLSSHIGNFDNLDEAIKARKLAEIGKGFSERHGSK